MKNFNSILIANRGEIACRVIGTAKQLGYRTIAVYSDADAQAPHVQMADQSVHIGPSPADQSYLVPELILQAAEKTAAGAIHPGYGFLSENAAFAQSVEQAGLIFIGPSREAIEVMGNKAESKRRMLEAGVPCIPGYLGHDQCDKTLKVEGAKIDLPLMVKAAAGGGGRGMRLVENYSQLTKAIKLARAEAESAFGCGELILEKALVQPRHVEIQILADSHGNVIHLGERDCSIQRRHQKVIEEAPCPIMSAELREKIAQSAIDAARSVNYCGVGTVEFLLDASGSFYFLEMNTRLQVEHPVTELITGLDLVALQISVAQGEPLAIDQAAINLEGHAIEVRLYTEDPSEDFMPLSGPIDLWQPATGVGVRIDAGIGSGQEISPFYDPMVAKVIGFGANRESARQRLLGALKETVLFGTTSNKNFLIDCLQKPSFIEGSATTAFIAEQFSAADLQVSPPSFTDSAVAAVIELSMAYGHYHDRSLLVSDCLKNWTSSCALVSRKQYQFGDIIHDLSVTYQAGSASSCTVVDGEQTVQIQMQSIDGNIAVLLVDTVKQTATFMMPEYGQLYCSIEGRSALFRDRIIVDGMAHVATGGGRVTAPMHGLLLEVLVTSGDTVVKGQTLAVLEAMKMHYEIVADMDGNVTQVTAVAGNQVAADEMLIQIEE